MNNGPERTSTEELDSGLSIDDGFDAQATELLKLEAELKSLDGAEIKFDKVDDSGTVVGVERVQIENVPDSYPISFHSPHALKLDVQLGLERETTVYLDWPDRLTEDTPLIRLLTTLDISLQSFADIMGEEIPLELDGSYYLAHIPDKSTEHSEDVSRFWHYVIIASLFSWISFWFAPDFSLTGGSMLFVVWPLYPLAIYFDSKRVRARSTWTPHKWLWTVLSFIWFINIPLGIAYLYKRHRAELSPE